ncbi:MAG: DNA helicase, partial [Actinomycetes bacterium]|nr:DNA helicase [Actinomycetes bacterium]
RLAEHFRALDRAQVKSLPGPVRRAVGRRLGRVIAADKVAAQELWRELSRPHLTNVRSLRTRFPDLLTAVRPVWVVPPMLVGQVLPPRTDVDLLVVDGAQHLPTANVVGAIARARQVVLVGDSSREGPGIVDELTGTLPAAVLPTDRAQREEHIAAFLAGHGYDGVVDSVPARPTPSTLRLHLVEGFGMPAVGAVAVEGVDSEVSRVLDLVRAHAERPDGTLAVVSLSSVTAQRIRGAIRQDAALARLLEDPERFTVTDVEDVGGLRYDTVLLSVGFAKTPHGRVLHRFGPVSSPEGLSLMVDLLDTVRHNLHIVSCLAPEDLERDRLGHAGAHLLADLLDLASDSPAEPGSSKARSQPAEGEPDLLLHDLTG